MPLRRSQGDLRPETPRPNELPDPPLAELRPAIRGPDGRFVPGGPGGKLKKLRRAAKALPWLEEERVPADLRPFVRAAKQHAEDLLAVLPPGEPLIAALAEETAIARIVTRLLIARGLEGDAEALEASRGWIRESRQCALSLAGLSRGLERGDDDSDLAKRRAEFQRRLQEQQRAAIETTGTGEDEK